jgi:serine/threonine protein kinase/Tfp pilus assembly protein PilF
VSERPPDPDVDMLITVEGNETHDLVEAAAADADPTVSAERLPGEHVGRYVLVDRIGRGGMGVVYGAYDPELDRKVALKLVRADANSAASSERLIREAQAMARLNHRNVITVHDVGRLDDGAVFIAMEFVEGPTLAHWQRDPARTSHEILEVYVQAGKGLAAAHDVRLVHRDFKPENVLIDPRGRAVVLDFGLARHDEAMVAAALSGVFPRLEAELGAGLAREDIEETISESLSMLSHDADRSQRLVETGSGLTRTGALLGTPAYMAPEQHTGGRVGAPSDQFAYCVALWEALFDERPYPGENLAAIAFSVLQGELRDPPEGSDVPTRVVQALRRGLATNPAQRFDDMHALIEVLRPERPATSRGSWVALAITSVGFAVALGFALVEEEPVSTCSNVDHPLDRVWNDQRRGDLEGAFLRTGAPFAGDAWNRSALAIDAWATQWREIRRDACEATRIRGEQSDTLMDLRIACLDRSLAEVRTVIDRFADPDARTVEHAPEAVEALPQLGPCSDAEGLRRAVPPPRDPESVAAVARIRERLGAAASAKAAGDKETGLRIAEDALDDANRIGYAPVIAEAAIKVGEMRTAAYAFDRAAEALREAVLIAERSGDPRVGAKAWIALVAVHGSEQFEMKAAHDAAEHARAYLDRFAPLEPMRAEFHENLAQVLEWEGKYPEAIAEAEKALAIVVQNGNEVSLAAASIYTSMGNSNWELGRLDDALRLHEKAHALDVQILGPAHPSRADALSNMGIIHDERGDYAKARTLYQESIDIVTAAGRADDGDLGVFNNNMASTYLAEARWDEAERYYDLAHGHWISAYGHKHPDIAMVLTNLALVDEHAGDLDSALARYDRAIEIYVDHFGPEHREVAWTKAARADITRQVGRLGEAREALRNGIELSIAAVGPDHEDVAQARIHLGRVFLDLGAWTDAREQFERAAEIRETRYGSEHQMTVVAAGLAAVAAWEAGDAHTARARLAESIDGIANAPSEDDAHALIRFAFARAHADASPELARAAAERAEAYYRSAPAQFAPAAAKVKRWLSGPTLRDPR